MSMSISRRKKWFGRILSCVSTNSEATLEMEHINNQPGIINILLFSHGMVEYNTRGNTLTAEVLCAWAAKKCGIPRLFSSLFGMYNKKLETWFAPARDVAPSDNHFIFRLRFHTSTDLTALEERVVAYMFEQYRYDFHHDKMHGLSTEEALGLMVLDLVRYGRENKIVVNKVCEHITFSSYLPMSLATNLTCIDQFKLKRKVKRSLETFQEDHREAITFKVMFMVSLMEERRRWGAEEFETVTGDKYSISAAKGVQKYSLETQTFEDSIQFEDMSDIILYETRNCTENWVIHINRRNGAPKTFEVQNQDQAESIATCIDGYYRLLVDFYHYLNHDCAPPSLVALVKTRCHGPIPLSVATTKLKDASQPDGTFIIRQNPEDYDSFCLTVQIGEGVKNYKICVYEDGQIGLPDQRRFDNIRQFMDFYREQNNAWCLHNIPLRKYVQYKNREACLTMLDRSIRSGPPRLPNAEDEPRIEWVPESDMNTRSEWRRLGRGAFTIVYKGEIRKRGKDWFPVALKCPREKAPQAVKDKFSQSVDAIASWKHAHIIRFQGIGGGRSPVLIMEYTPYKTLDKYLKLNKTTLKISHQLTAAVQIINALDYLESRNIVHGNISAHNVLVTRPANQQLVVKLGDPMLSVYYHSLPIDKDIKMKRVRWTAPELLCTNAEATLASDKWSYGITLWEIMAFGELPCAGFSDKAVMDNYKEGRRLGKPANCPDAVYKIMEHCWLHVPQSRPQCKCILRDMNTILMICYKDNGIEPMYYEPENPDDPLPISEDEESANEDEDDDDDMANSESSDQMTDHGITDMGQANTHVPNGQTQIISQEDKDNFQSDIDSREFSSGAMIRWSNLGTQELEHGDVKINLDKSGSLGAGQFGIVRKGEWLRMSGFMMTVAIKLPKESEMRSEEDRKSFMEEIRHMSLCKHKNIVEVYGFVQTERGQIQMVMEFVKFGALNSYLRLYKKSNQPVGDQTLFLFGQQICQGMAFLGQKKMVHRDLAARNILVASENEVKITDFGLARDFTANRDYYRMTGRHNTLPIKWHSPESISDRRFTVQGDVWSFGVVLWEMFSHGDSPNYGQTFEAAEQLYEKLKSGSRLPDPPNCPTKIHEMMNDCWHFDKDKRPNFTELVRRLGEFMVRPPSS